MHDVETDRPREADRLGQPRIGGAREIVRDRAIRRARPLSAVPRQDDGRVRRCRPGLCGRAQSDPAETGSRAVNVFGPGVVAAPSVFGPSNSWIGAPGMTVLIACL